MATSWQIEQPTKQAFTDVVVDSTCNITFGDETITMDDTSNLKVGMYVRGIYPPFEYGTNTTSTIYQVASITNSTTFELNVVNIKGTESNVTLEFFHLGSFSPGNVTGKANSTDNFTLNAKSLISDMMTVSNLSADADSNLGVISGIHRIQDTIPIGTIIKISSPNPILNNNSYEITGSVGTTSVTFSVTVEEDISAHEAIIEKNPETQSWAFDGKISSGTTYGLDGTIATGTSWGFDGKIT